MTTRTNPTPPFDDIVSSRAFARLLRSRRAFIVPATLFFLAYYFALPVLTGYWPEFMGQKVFGHFSLAYLFALSQFPMAWIVAGLYLYAAAGFDRQAARILQDSGVAPQEDSAE
ncbi:MAG: DUF485 domain-containing protein [Acidobacteria bacterium]|nr:DUF485 domain-containing protein [Acidobacteriota bacterium]